MDGGTPLTFEQEVEFLRLNVIAASWVEQYYHKSLGKGPIDTAGMMFEAVTIADAAVDEYREFNPQPVGTPS